MDSLKNRLPLLVRQFPRIGEEGIERAATADPTPQKKYLTWILRMVTRRSILLPEDAGKVRSRLEEFNRIKKLKTFTGKRDIGAYRDYAELAATVRDVLDQERGAQEQARQQVVAGTRSIYRGGGSGFTIEKITTPEAAMVAAEGTEWCTLDRETAEQYLERGPLYVVFKPGSRFKFVESLTPYAQVHPVEGQWKDVLDRDLPAAVIHELRGLLEEELGSDYRTQPAAALAHVEMLLGIFGEKYVTDFELSSDMDEEIFADFVKEIGGENMEELEKVIATDLQATVYYANLMRCGRFPVAEPALLSSPKAAAQYAVAVLHDRWPEAEPVIARDGRASYHYAFHALGGLWPDENTSEQERPADGGRHHDFVRQSYDEAILNDAPEVRRAWEPDLPRTAYEYVTDVLAARRFVAETGRRPQIAPDDLAGAIRLKAAEYFLEWASCNQATQEKVEGILLESEDFSTRYTRLMAGPNWSELERLSRRGGNYDFHRGIELLHELLPEVCVTTFAGVGVMPEVSGLVDAYLPVRDETQQHTLTA